MTLPAGAGRLVLVVGPSGSGKDTLIAGAKVAFRNDDTIAFPRRVVTRQANDSEDHDSLSVLDFDRAKDDGAFAFWWEAHRLKYAFPRGVEDDIAAGRTVVCNVSRSIVTDLRKRYERTEVVLVTAPDDILLARLAARDRATDGPAGERMKRSAQFTSFHADHRIDNTGDVGAGVDALCRIIRATN